MSRIGGFTLVELMVVIVIFGFLMTMVTPAISTWQTKHRAEGEIERLHSDLQYARMQAYVEKVTWGVWWGSGNNPFTRYEIRRDNYAQSSSNLKLAVRSTNGTIGSITFDSRGFCNVKTTLQVTESHGASVDCLAISATRVRMGRWQWDNDEHEYRCVPK